MRSAPTLRPRLLAVAVFLGVSCPPSNAAALPAPGRFGGVDRVFLDRSLHDLDRRPSAEAADIARQLGLEAFLPPQPENTLAVTNCNDNGAGSLRATVAAAVSGDVVDLRGLGCATIALSSGPIAISQDSLTVIGRRADAIAVHAGGGKYNNRVFDHSGQGLLLIEGITISGGTVAGSSDAPSVAGGCIDSAGTVSLGNALFVGVPEYGAVVENCRAIANASGNGLASGGGVYANELLMTNSRISGCEIEAHSDGAGLHVDGGGGAAAYARAALFQSQLTGNLESGSKYGGGGLTVFPTQTSTTLVIASTISGNQARVGGGLTIGSTVTVRNSTVSGNSASRAAGIAIAGIGGAATIENTTVTANIGSSDDSGNGIYFSGTGSSTMTSTIVWGNFRSTTVPDDVGGNSVPGGSANLVGISSLTLPADTILGVDPHLRPLADNGGPTQTHALLGDSQAIGRGANPENETWDQRGTGHPRVVGQHADIGAFEYSDVIFADGFD